MVGPSCVGVGEEAYAFIARVGRRIAFARKQSGLTQERLAERSGITQQMLARTEKARHPGVSLATLCKIASGLGVSTANLVDVTAPVSLPGSRHSQSFRSLKAMDRKLSRFSPAERRQVEEVLHRIVDTVRRKKPSARGRAPARISTGRKHALSKYRARE